MRRLGRRSDGVPSSTGGVQGSWAVSCLVRRGRATGARDWQVPSSTAGGTKRREKAGVLRYRQQADHCNHHEQASRGCAPTD